MVTKDGEYIRCDTLDAPEADGSEALDQRG
jgi:hypothetical protein